MLSTTLTHSLDTTDDQVARCGRPLTVLDTPSAQPTCATCAARVLTEEQYDDAIQALEDICFDDAEVEL